jgi:hypothetical protein
MADMDARFGCDGGRGNRLLLGHRLSHEVPFLWRFHAIHHSAEHIDFLVSTRAHPVDFVFTRICMLAPLYALGLVGTVHMTDGAIAMGVILAGLVWEYFVHANLRWRLGPLEWIIATPGFHHWHHTYGLQRNCNMHRCCRGSIAFLARIICRRFGHRDMESLNPWPPPWLGSSSNRSRRSAARPRRLTPPRLKA